MYIIPAKMKLLSLIAKKLLESRNYSFPLVRFRKWKLKLVSNILQLIVGLQTS